MGYGVYWTCTASFTPASVSIEDCIIAKCSQSGVYVDLYDPVVLKNNTIDGNGGDGLTVGTGFISSLVTSTVINNIFSNHTGGGKYGINGAGGGVLNFVDYNTFYNNTADITGGYGPHDTHGGANPYRNQPVEDYTLA